MRNLSALVGYCALYEFEDVVAGLTRASIVSPGDGDRLELWRRAFRATRVATGSRSLAALVAALGSRQVSGIFDVFLACFNHPYELFALSALRGWRERCGLGVCYLAEAWPHRLPEYLIELLAPFDHVFVGVRGATEQISRITGKPCSYVPFGVDVTEFSPHPAHPIRSIDVCAIGRRSAVTHEALLQLSSSKGLFYTTTPSAPGGHRELATQMTFMVSEPREHRLLLANLLKRTRYLLANRGWADEPSMSIARDVIGSRFYEGVAAGAILLGSPPEGPDFDAQFGWPDAVVKMPFHAPSVGELIAQLEADPVRAARIRRENAANALLRHDWAYRWHEMTRLVQMPPTAALLAREAHLARLAEEARCPARLTRGA